MSVSRNYTAIATYTVPTSMEPDDVFDAPTRSGTPGDRSARIVGFGPKGAFTTFPAALTVGGSGDTESSYDLQSTRRFPAGRVKFLFDGAIPVTSAIIAVTPTVTVDFPTLNSWYLFTFSKGATSIGSFAWDDSVIVNPATPSTHPDYQTTDAIGIPWTLGEVFDSEFGVMGGNDTWASVQPEAGSVITWEDISLTVYFTLPSPTASTSASPRSDSRGVTFLGTVNPAYATTEYPVSVKFEYGTTQALGSETTTIQTLTGSSDVTVGLHVWELEPDTPYFYRIVAYNDDWTVNGSLKAANTNAYPTPVPLVDPPYTIHASGAEFQGTVDYASWETLPDDVTTEYYLTYGTTETPPTTTIHGISIWNNSTPVSSAYNMVTGPTGGVAGSKPEYTSEGTEPTYFSALTVPQLTFPIVLSGLTPSTTYYYRLVAVNPTSGGASAIASFTTAADIQSLMVL
jgi:hypothetical protein